MWRMPFETHTTGALQCMLSLETLAGGDICSDDRIGVYSRSHSNRYIMAIPSWLWPGDDSSSRTPDRLLDPETTTASEIEDVSNLFELLSNETRLEILSALHSRTGPLSYTELRGETSIEDKGKFNYHLRQLSAFIDRQEGEYRLTAKGDRISQNIADDRYSFDSD